MILSDLAREERESRLQYELECRIREQLDYEEELALLELEKQYHFMNFDEE